jgi:ribosome-binding factor A
MRTRLAKVNTLIQKELSRLIHENLDFSAGILVTITRVEVSVDLRYATVYVSVLPVQRLPSTLQLLQRKAAMLQRLLSKRLVMRSLPRLRFVLDPGERHAARIEKLLAEEKRFGPRQKPQK